jgi:hypothetical protein
MRQAVTDMSPDIEAEIARPNELAIKASGPPELERIAAIDHGRAGDAVAAL